MYKISETGMRTERKTIKLDINTEFARKVRVRYQDAHMEVAKGALNL